MEFYNCLLKTKILITQTRNFKAIFKIFSPLFVLKLGNEYKLVQFQILL